MNITVEIKDSDRLIAALETLAGAIIANNSLGTPVAAAAPVAAPVAAEPAADKPRRGRPPKEAAEQAPVKASAPAAPVVEETQASEDPFGSEEAAPAASAPTYTLDDVRTAGLAYRDKHGQDAAKALVKRVGGVEKLADMAEDRFAAFIAATKQAPGADDGL